jgi:hypothetical protein
MPKFLLAYHGGSMPETEAAQAELMQAWGAWFGSLGSAVIDGGNPVGQSHTISADSVVENGGANPVSGYSLIEAADYGDAIAKAKGSPHIASGGSVEVAQAIDM